MGRSSREQAEANRARIVEAASSLFRSRSYDSVGVADIMKAAGMTQGGFYKHFASKDSLAAEAWKHAFATSADSWSSRVDPSAAETSETQIASYYLAPKPPELTCPMLAFGDHARNAPGEDVTTAAYAAGARSLLETYLEAAAAGSAPDPDRSMTNFAAMVGANMLQRAAPGDPALKAVCEAVLRKIAADGRP